jgi:hypothetical protein
MTLAIIIAAAAIDAALLWRVIHCARPHDPQQGSAQGEGDGAGESGFVQHHGSVNK